MKVARRNMKENLKTEWLMEKETFIMQQGKKPLKENLSQEKFMEKLI